MNASDFLPHQTFILRWHAAKHPQRKLRSNMILLCSIEDQLEPSSARWKEIDIFPTCYRLSWFPKKTWLQDKTVWVPMRTCEILPHKSWQPMDRRSLRKNAATSSVAKHVQEDDLFERLDQALWSGRDINFLEVRRNVYTGPLHISILVSELTFSNDIVTLCLWPWYSTPSFCFGSLFICMNEYNSIPKKAAKISMPKLCVCIICSSQSFKFSNLLLILELFVTQILHSYTLDLVDLNGVVGQELQGDSLLLTYQLMGLLCNSCFCWKLGYAALTQWSQPCLLGLRHLFIRYLHQRGLVT